MNLPVSVIIPTYNRAALAARAVQSALGAIRPGDEVLVADDASTDETPRVMAEFGDAVRYVRLPHGGAAATRNAAVRLAAHPLVAFLDSDDEWLNHKLTLQRALMAARPELLFCFTDFVVREDRGVEHAHYLNHWHGGPIDWNALLGTGVSFSSVAALPDGVSDFPVHIGSLYLAQMEGEYVLTSSLVVRKEAAGAALCFGEDLPTFEDVDCFARLSQAGPAAYLDRELVRQWAHDLGRLSDEADAFCHAGVRLTILDRVWGRDQTFLAQFGERYRRRRRAMHLLRARWLLCRGRPREARSELQSSGGAPHSYRLLATLPGSLTRLLLSARSLARSHA